PATKAVFDLSQGLWQEDLTLGTRVTYVASQDQVPADNAVAEYDSYALWDLYLSWQPAMGSLSGLRVDLAVDNLTDRYYRQAWQTLYEQGRNARLGLRYSF
ncbi:MAG: TonB-dependent receptor, partial [Corallincola sp.]|nr:TonB-dependent receptor [Corallincola sp.]